MVAAKYKCDEKSNDTTHLEQIKKKWIHFHACMITLNIQVSFYFIIFYLMIQFLSQAKNEKETRVQ